MPVIQIPFDQSLANVTISRGPLTLPPPNPQPESKPDHKIQSNSDDEVAALTQQTLQSIERQLQRLDAKLSEEFSSIGVQLTAAATQIAKEALGSESELVEERVAHFANILLRQVHPSQSAVIFVNPKCVASLESWLSQVDYEAIEIQADTTVQPGDCRIESNGKGFLASLESFLDAAAKRMSSARGES